MCLIELRPTECEQSFYRDSKDFWGQCCTRREAQVHQRIQPTSSRHVICDWQRRRELLLNKQAEDLVRVRGLSAENTLSNLFGRYEPLEGLRVCITDDAEDSRSDSRHFILCRDSEEGGECGEIRHSVPFRESVGGESQRSDSLEWRQKRTPEGTRCLEV